MEKNIQVIKRCFTILEMIAANGGSASLSVISKTSSLPHSTTHRILSTLMNKGYIEQDEENGYYRLGLKLLHLSNTVIENLDLRQASKKYLEELMKITGETANLVVLDKDEVVYLEKVETKATLRVFSLIGSRAPVHVTGAGKILLSEMAQQDIIDILRSAGMPRLTPNSITDIDTMLEELVKVRKQGFAIDDEECELGARCVAVPVRNHRGRVIAAMSVSGPVTRIGMDRLKKFTEVIKQYASNLSRELGYNEELRRIKGSNPISTTQ